MPEIAESVTSDLLRGYDNSKWLKPLIEIAFGHFGTAANTYIENRLKQIDSDRLRTFFDELAAGQKPLSPEIIASEEFLHCFFATTRAVRKTHHRQKIRFFARLLGAAADDPALPHVDRYERYLGMLEELTYEELQVLVVVAKYERSVATAGSAVQKTSTYWPRLIAELGDVLKLPKEGVDAVLTRMTRTGAYQPITGSFWDYEGGHGTLTPLYYELERMARFERD